MAKMQTFCGIQINSEVDSSIVEMSSIIYFDLAWFQKHVKKTIQEHPEPSRSMSKISSIFNYEGLCFYLHLSRSGVNF
jgi:hypothetical protein